MRILFQKFKNYLITEKRVASNTVDAYSRDIEQFLQFLDKNGTIESFADVTSQHIKDFLKQMRYNQGIGAKSSSRKLSALKTFANYLSKYHDYASFAQGVKFPQLPKHLPKHLTQEQIKTLLLTADCQKTVSGQRNKVMLCLLYACGVRVSELIVIKISDVNFEDRCLMVSGKGGKDRIVPLPEEIIQLLQSYLHHIHTRLLGVGKQYFNTEFLFPALYGGKISHITRQSFWKIVKDIATQSGLMHAVSPHVLRHSLATHMLKRGANLRVLQTLLGHEKISTVQIYTHLETSHLREMYDKYHSRA